MSAGHLTALDAAVVMNSLIVGAVGYLSTGVAFGACTSPIRKPILVDRCFQRFRDFDGYLFLHHQFIF